MSPSKFTRWGRSNGWRYVVALGYIGLAAPLAHAVAIAPGGLVNMSGTTFAGRPELGGTVLEDTTRNFSVDFTAFGGGIITGHIQDRVVRETGTGTLDFYYRVFNDAGSGDGNGLVIRASRDGFTNFSTDVDFRIDGLGSVGPTPAFRTADGSQIQFNFSQSPGVGNALPAGSSSLFFFVHTAATDYAETGTLELDVTNPHAVVGREIRLVTFAPVPLPAAAWLMLSGLGGLAALARRRAMGI